MPLLDQAAKLATQRLPKVITPKAHSMIDYAIACGAAETALALSTDYSGGATKRLGFETHNNIDFAMSGIVSSIPSVLHFADEPEAHYFRAHGVAIAAVAGLTKIEEHAGELGIDAA